jgi:hypothetical protein
MKKLLICSSNIAQLDSLCDSGFLKNISDLYNLTFLIRGLNKNDSKRITVIKKFGKIFECSGINKDVSRRSFRQKLNLFCYYGNEILKNKNRFNSKFLIQRTLEVNAPHLINFFKFLYNFKLLNIFVSIISYFLRSNPINVFENKNFKEFDLVLIAYKIYDPTSFTDELIRFSASLITESLIRPLNSK